MRSQLTSRMQKSPESVLFALRLTEDPDRKIGVFSLRPALISTRLMR